MSAELSSGTSSIKAAIRKRCYERSATTHELNKDIDELEKIDKSAEKKIRSAMFLTFAPVIGCIVAGLSAGAMAPFIWTVCGLLIVVGIVLWTTWAKYEFSDLRYMLARELLLLCSRDIVEAQPVRLKINFNSVNRKDTQVRKASDRTIYKDTWLLLNGAFADGSKFNLQVEETVHVKFRKGKLKAKGYVMSLTIAFSKKSYGVLQLEQVASNKLVRIEENTQLKTCRGKGNALYLSAKVPPIYDFKDNKGVNQFLQLAKYLLLSAYGTLNATKKPGASA